MTELEKMKNGQWYDANYDTELLSLRQKAKDLCNEYNNIPYADEEKRQAKLSEILGYTPRNCDIASPLMVDYGFNVIIGSNCSINHNVYFMDGAKITIGDNVFIGPSTGFYTANHPIDYKNRNLGLEQALPITIGSNSWIGANVTVLPGVTIGEGCVIGAGSVVTKDIPPHSLAYGNPCKVVRKIKQDDRDIMI